MNRQGWVRFQVVTVASVLWAGALCNVVEPCAMRTTALLQAATTQKTAILN